MPKVVPPSGYEIPRMASLVTVTDRLVRTIVHPVLYMFAKQAACDMLRAALRGMWNDRVVSKVEEAKNYFLWTDDVPDL
ncbi:hypothetical protein LTR56_002436 [Elasticomyces elasticus]|nr:hypothetical protein LTR22_012161 [Elasticomyces elasticus]KAK3657296.1 hypothetical protein LTR56_002436 [Elasticomyces elasticus]KAK4933623.1 hypothetical protein LTR49_000087 [Elasticomyces elasticus]KAK5753736.1 hypothetical protein LTS12_016151 [Elasticomyces elasticus]